VRDLACILRATARLHNSYSQVAEFMSHVDAHLSAIAFAEETNRAQAAPGATDPLAFPWACYEKCDTRSECYLLGCSKLAALYGRSHV
jgi:hypothetical protein